MTECEAIDSQKDMSDLDIGNFAWTSQSTKLLLQKYYERKIKFCNPKIKKKLLWTEIVEEFKIKGYNVNEDILDRKMRNLKQSYKSIKENNRKTGTGLDRITWKWYDTMDSLFKDDRIVNPIAKQATAKNAHKPEKAESMDLAAERRELISAANKIFGEGKWSHTVVSQTLDFVEIIGAKCCTGCVSFVKVQLENGSFHEDIGYYNAEEATKGLSIYNARIGSTINALKRVLLSFGDKIEREISPEQANDVQRNVVLLNKQISNPNVLLNTYSGVSLVCTSRDLANPTYVTLKRSIGNEQAVTVTNDLQADCTSISDSNKNPNLLLIDSAPVTIINNDQTDSEANTSSSAKIESVKIVKSSPNKTNNTNEWKSKTALLSKEILRIERKRKQKEKQMEFKKRMMEKEELMVTSENKPNPRY